MSAKDFKNNLQVIACDRKAKRKLQFYIFQQKIHCTKKRITLVFIIGMIAGVIETATAKFVLSLLC